VSASQSGPTTIAFFFQIRSKGQKRLRTTGLKESPVGSIGVGRIFPGMAKMMLKI